MSYILSIGTIFKNEAPYLKEWIEHYLARGVDHFFLINDGSDDNYKEVLKPYEEKITLFDSSGKELESFDRQNILYNKHIYPLLNQTEWILVCDIDEYIWSPIYLNLKDAVNQCEKAKIFYYKIPEVIFGNNNHEDQPESIVKSFTKRIEVTKQYMDYIEYFSKYKTIAKASKLKDLVNHTPWSEETKFFQNSVNLNLNLFRLNHYRFQSLNKWKNNIKLRDVNNYAPRAKHIFCYGLNGPINNFADNYRTIELYKEANQVCNKIEDFDLINQNKKYNEY